MKKLMAIFIVTLLLITYSSAEIKIGFVNTQQIISSTKIGIAMAKKLEKKQKEERDKLLTFQEKITLLEKEISSPSITKALKQSKSRELFKAKRELKAKYDRITADFQKYTQKEIKNLENKVNPIIQNIGKDRGYTAIYDVQRSGTIYINKSVNITKSVIDAINRKYSN